MTALTWPSSGAVIPNAERIAVAYVGALLGTTVGVSTSLPIDTEWPVVSTTGSSRSVHWFVQVTSAGGAPNVDIPSRQLVVTVDCWAYSTNHDDPPWRQAFLLADMIVEATYLPTAHRLVDVGSGTRLAIVNSAYPVTDPRKVPSDPGYYARVTTDLVLHVAVLPTAIPPVEEES